MRRVQVGYRVTTLGVHQPLFGLREGKCAICDGEGCREADRIARLARVVAERMDAVPENQSRRTEALIDLRRALAASLACAPKALALRSRELASDALVRSRDGPEPVLLVAQTLAAPARGAAAASRSPPDSAEDLLLEAAGTLWRVHGEGVPAACAKGWIAVLGWIEPPGTAPATSIRAGQQVRVVEVRAIVCAVFEPPPLPPPTPPPKKPRP